MKMAIGECLEVGYHFAKKREKEFKVNRRVAVTELEVEL